MIERSKDFEWVDDNGNLFVADAEGLELEETLANFDEEFVVVVHLFDDFDDIGNELISDSVVSQYRSDH